MNSTFTRAILAVSITAPFLISWLLGIPSMGFLPIAIGLSYTISSKTGLIMVATFPLAVFSRFGFAFINYLYELNLMFHFPLYYSIPIGYIALFVTIFANTRIIRKIMLPILNKRLPRRYAL